MKLKTNIIFVITSVVVVLMFIIAAFHEYYDADQSNAAWLVIVWVLVFGFNVAGLIFGLQERKKGMKNALVGILGNLAHLLFFLGFALYAAITS